jgi:membrane-bound lytic murein transglycosylase B
VRGAIRVARFSWWGMGDLGKTLRALAFVAMAAFFTAAPASAAEDCGKSGEGFSAWLESFKQVAVGNGLSRRAVDAALDGVTYNPAVKRHDGGAAMFGHNFAGFAAAHVTPGMVARGKAELKRYAAPLATIEQRFGVPGPVVVAIWGQETSFGGDNGAFPFGLGLPPV